MFAAVITTSTTAHVVAQPYPAKPIRLIIPAGPGGGVDTIARVVGQSLSRLLGQPVVMDNRAGAGTMLASELTAKAPPDGYTLLMITNSHAINAGLHSNMSYDPVNDFSFISSVASVPYLVVVHPSVAAASVRELIALARRQPGSLYFALMLFLHGRLLAFGTLNFDFGIFSVWREATYNIPRTGLAEAYEAV